MHSSAIGEHETNPSDATTSHHTNTLPIAPTAADTAEIDPRMPPDEFFGEERQIVKDAFMSYLRHHGKLPDAVDAGLIANTDEIPPLMRFDMENVSAYSDMVMCREKVIVNDPKLVRRGILALDINGPEKRVLLDFFAGMFNQELLNEFVSQYDLDKFLASLQLVNGLTSKLAIDDISRVEKIIMKLSREDESMAAMNAMSMETNVHPSEELHLSEEPKLIEQEKQLTLEEYWRIYGELPAKIGGMFVREWFSTLPQRIHVRRSGSKGSYNKKAVKPVSEAMKQKLEEGTHEAAKEVVNTVVKMAIDTQNVEDMPDAYFECYEEGMKLLKSTVPIEIKEKYPDLAPSRIADIPVEGDPISKIKLLLDCARNARYGEAGGYEAYGRARMIEARYIDKHYETV